MVGTKRKLYSPAESKCQLQIGLNSCSPAIKKPETTKIRKKQIISLVMLISYFLIPLHIQNITVRAAHMSYFSYVW